MELAKTLHCPRCGIVIPREEILEKRKCARCGWVFNLKWLGGADSETSDSICDPIGDPGEQASRVDSTKLPQMVYCPSCGYELKAAVHYNRCPHCKFVFWYGDTYIPSADGKLDMTYIQGGGTPYDSADSPEQVDTLVQEDNSTIQVKPPILAEASELIHGDRAKDYGDAKESFAHIAALWSAYTKTTISPQDVAMMMSLLKMSRAKHSGFTHRDSFVDMAGYVALASDIGE